MTLQFGKQTILKYTYYPISQEVKAITHQLIEHNRNIFLENWYTKCGGETIPRPFSEKSKLCMPLNQ